MNVMLNARKIEINEDEISYEKIMELLGEREDRVLSVAYFVKNGKHGILSKGKSVKLVENMSLSAYDTSNA